MAIFVMNIEFKFYKYYPMVTVLDAIMFNLGKLKMVFSVLTF